MAQKYKYLWITVRKSKNACRQFQLTDFKFKIFCKKTDNKGEKYRQK